jgi:tetratricopeptide (TPR) repeat protein
MEQAQHLQAAFQSAMQTDDAGQQWNAAARLLTGQLYQEAVAAFEALGRRYPDRLGAALSQVGAARFFLGDYDAAIDDYVAARDHGFDADMTDDNVWEACLALHAKGVATAGRRYLAACPQGRYAKKAARL